MSRRKKGIGAEERRQLRRQLQRAELEKEVLRTELRRTEDEERRAHAEVVLGGWMQQRPEGVKKEVEQLRRERQRAQEEETRPVKEQWLEKEAGWRAELIICS